MVASYRAAPIADDSADAEVRALCATLGEVLTFVAQRAPLAVALALKPEVSLVVFLADGTQLPYRIRFFAPAHVGVSPGDVKAPATRIALTKKALRQWVQGRLDVKDAVRQRTFLVGGDPAPFYKLAEALAVVTATSKAPVASLPAGSSFARVVRASNLIAGGNR